MSESIVARISAMPEMNNVHQLVGWLFVAAGLCATLCGFGVLSPPPNTSAARIAHFLWVGPLAIVIGILEIIATR